MCGEIVSVGIAQNKLVLGVITIGSLDGWDKDFNSLITPFKAYRINFVLTSDYQNAPPINGWFELITFQYSYFFYQLAFGTDSIYLRLLYVNWRNWKNVTLT